MNQIWTELFNTNFRHQQFVGIDFHIEHNRKTYFLLIGWK